jgi:hypothetical protein
MLNDLKEDFWVRTELRKQALRASVDFEAIALTIAVVAFVPPPHSG